MVVSQAFLIGGLLNKTKWWRSLALVHHFERISYHIDESEDDYDNDIGAWNDPDMLIIGDFALSIDEAKTQMAIWYHTPPLPII